MFKVVQRDQRSWFWYIYDTRNRKNIGFTSSKSWGKEVGKKLSTKGFQGRIPAFIINGGLVNFDVGFGKPVAKRTLI